MARRRSRSEQVFQRFLRRVWRDDISPQLRGRRARQREKSARAGGTLAAGTGSMLDRLLRLDGRPFARAMTVMGSSIGAMLPDVLDWKWVSAAGRAVKKLTAERVQEAAARLPESDALALFGLTARATRKEAHQAWRAAARRWHPDTAPDETRRVEYHVRFLAYQSAYERLCNAYDARRLPRRSTQA